MGKRKWNSRNILKINKRKGERNIKRNKMEKKIESTRYTEYEWEKKKRRYERMGKRKWS